MKHHAQLAGGPSDPKDVVPRDEGTRVSGERSTTPTRRSAHPPPKSWCPATKEQGLAGSGAPRPLSRRLHHSGGTPHSPPAEGSSSSVSPPHTRPEAPAGRHPHPAPPGRSLIQTDAGPSCRRQPNLVPEVTQTLTGVLSPPEPEAPRPPGRRPTYARSRLGCNSKAGKSKKQGLPAGSPCFYLHSQSCGCAGSLLLFAILRLRRIPFAVCNPAAAQDSFCCF